ncbi:MAG: hypothetical protein KDD51_01265 [Bdellovibrionales bacterium]|nr:hypothetical protein [Bdellovibrionales bacterium]
MAFWLQHSPVHMGRKTKFIIVPRIVLALLWGFQPSAQGTSAEDIVRLIYKRLPGDVPTSTELQLGAEDIRAGRFEAVVRRATSKTGFFRVIKEWASVLTNVGTDANVSYNEMSAMFVLAARDGIDARELLTGKWTATYNPELIQGVAGRVIEEMYPARTNNKHYAYVETHFSDIGSALQKINQRTATKIKNTDDTFTDDPSEVPEAEISGILTSRPAGEEYLSAGTNRRLIRWIMEHLLCTPLSSIRDTREPDFRVRHDVAREPGEYNNNCVGCHAKLDSQAGALAYFDFNSNRFRYRSDRVQNKYLQNADTSPEVGYNTTDDSWLNVMRDYNNARLGWGSADKEGNGLASYAAAIASTEAYPKCLAQTAFKKVCRKEELDFQDKKTVDGLAQEFVDSGYNLKELFIQATVKCMEKL